MSAPKQESTFMKGPKQESTFAGNWINCQSVAVSACGLNILLKISQFQ
jgi:hypothetical protein